VTRAADQSLRISRRFDPGQRGRIGRFLRLLHQLALQQPGEWIEPEQGDGGARHHQCRPIAPFDMRHFMRQDRIGIFRPLERVAIEHDHRPQPAPAQRRVAGVRDEQANLRAGRPHARHRVEPVGIGDGRSLARPAAKRQQAGPDPQQHHRQPAKIQDRDQARRIVPRSWPAPAAARRSQLRGSRPRHRLSIGIGAIVSARGLDLQRGQEQGDRGQQQHAGLTPSRSTAARSAGLPRPAAGRPGAQAPPDIARLSRTSPQEGEASMTRDRSRFGSINRPLKLVSSSA
jgi:hypothetical protein